MKTKFTTAVGAGALLAVSTLFDAAHMPLEASSKTMVQGTRCDLSMRVTGGRATLYNDAKRTSVYNSYSFRYSVTLDIGHGVKGVVVKGGVTDLRNVWARTPIRNAEGAKKVCTDYQQRLLNLFDDKTKIRVNPIQYKLINRMSVDRRELLSPGSS